MNALRLIVCFLAITFLCAAVSAQRPGPQFRRPVSCEPLEPRTKLEEFDRRYATVLVKGFTQVATLNARDGDVRVDAMEYRDSGNGTRAAGLVIALRENREGIPENRSFIDYEEISLLVKAIDSLATANETMTKLVSFEVRYRTFGDLEISVFRQSRTGNAVSISSGICDTVTLTLTLDELTRLRGMILEAKTRLDEI